MAPALDMSCHGVDAATFQDVITGAGVGLLVGRLIVVRYEHRNGELQPSRVRQLETAWSLFGVAISIAPYLL
jgi:hypothetical protein